MKALVGALDRCGGKKIAVLGDYVLERFLRGRPASLSREAPTLVIQHESEEILPGGAGRAVCLLANLGCEVYPLGAVGDDAAGNDLIDLISRLCPYTEGLLKIRSRETAIRTRILAGDLGVRKQQILRIDRGKGAPLDNAYQARLLSELAGLPPMDAWVFIEAGGGLFTGELASSAVLTTADGPTIVDAGDRVMEFEGASHILLNATEAARAAGRREIRWESEAVEVAAALRERLDARGLLLTRGNAGMVVCDEDGAKQIAAIGGEEVVDPCGAGDAVTAGVCLALVAGLSWREAALFANLCAYLTVMRQGPAELPAAAVRKAIEAAEGGLT